MYTKIKAKKDLHNYGKCFTKGQTYNLPAPVENAPSLMEVRVINDLGEVHIIGNWWRNFTLTN